MVKKKVVFAKVQRPHTQHRRDNENGPGIVLEIQKTKTPSFFGSVGIHDRLQMTGLTLYSSIFRIRSFTAVSRTRRRSAGLLMSVGSVEPGAASAL